MKKLIWLAISIFLVFGFATFAIGVYKAPIAKNFSTVDIRQHVNRAAKGDRLPTGEPMENLSLDGGYRPVFTSKADACWVAQQAIETHQFFVTKEGELHTAFFTRNGKSFITDTEHPYGIPGKACPEQRQA